MEWAGIILSFAAGAALGLVFFGGLRLTVERLLTAKNPALLFLASLVLRSAAVVAGLYYVGAGDVRRLVAAVAGLFLMRAALFRLWGPAPRAAQGKGGA